MQRNLSSRKVWRLQIASGRRHIVSMRPNTDCVGPTKGVHRCGAGVSECVRQTVKMWPTECTTSVPEQMSSGSMPAMWPGNGRQMSMWPNGTAGEMSPIAYASR